MSLGRLRSTLATSAVAAAVLVPAHASSPKFFLAATQADFLRGEVENLSVDITGRLLLGPATELVYETAAPFVWSLTGDGDGVLMASTGNEGKVFRVDAQGAGSLFFQAGELEAHAVAPAPEGGVYVATSPDGKIYRVDRDGKATTFFNPDDKYVWALAADGSGNLYAGTGERGTVYRIAADGTGTPFYKANATHVTALSFDHNGDLLVGTQGPGRVVRVDSSGKPFVLLDSPFQEIRALRVDGKGAVYAAALNGRPSAGASPPPDTAGQPARVAPDPGRAPVPTVSTEITVAIVDAPSTPLQSAPREDRRTPKGAVYRIAPDGIWDQLWESRDDSPYDIAFDPNGAVLVATGNSGKVYRLEGDPIRPVLLIRAAAQQVTAFYRDLRGRLYYATANPGKVFRVTSERASRGAFESEPYDAQMLSSWGTIQWHGLTPRGSTIELSTRSGNTSSPDETWSAWSPPYKEPQGSPIVSPKSRYIQWRAVFEGRSESPVLTSVTTAYLQRNLRPQVRSITVHPPGVVFQKPYSTGEPELAGFEGQSTPDRKLSSAAMTAQPGAASTPPLGRRAYQKGLETFVWRADDENDDELVYDVLYRREGDTTWTLLKRDLSESIFVWDTTTVPNGTYFVKIVASDSPSNPSATVLRGELESSAFDVDNTPPSITVPGIRVESGRTIVTLDVKDDHAPILRVEISQDGQNWRVVFPADGLADSKRERYDVAIDGTLAAPGLIVRASDRMNNAATVEIPPPAER